MQYISAPNQLSLLYMYSFVSCMYLSASIMVLLGGMNHFAHSKNLQAAKIYFWGALGFFAFAASNLSFQNLLGAPAGQLMPPLLLRAAALCGPLGLIIITMIILHASLLGSIRAYEFVHRYDWLIKGLYVLAVVFFALILTTPSVRIAQVTGHWLYIPFCFAFALLCWHFFSNVWAKMIWTLGSIAMGLSLADMGVAFTQGLIPSSEPFMILANLLYSGLVFLIALTFVIYGFSGVERYQRIKMLDSKNVAHDLRRGVRENQLFLNYQPQLNTKTGRIESVEALVKWHHPRVGLISPDHFIPLAEEIEVIDEVTHWVIAQAFDDLSTLRELGHDLKVAINFSAQSIDPDMLGVLRAACSKYSVPPSQIVIEITERFWIHDCAEATGAIDELLDMGFGVSLDDFGTGQSSLQSFHNVQFSELKIDRSFVQDILTNSDHRSVVQSVIEMCNRMGICVVVEGVESSEVLELVTSFGAGVVQGFGIAKPMPLAPLTQWLTERSATKHRPLLQDKPISAHPALRA